MTNAKPTIDKSTPLHKFNALWFSIEQHMGVDPECAHWADEIRSALTSAPEQSDLRKKAIEWFKTITIGGLTSQGQEMAEYIISVLRAPGATIKTPSSKWSRNGDPDPHGDRYECERHELSLGDMTDDELANAVFMSADGKDLPMADAVKDRIRWLSRQLPKCYAPDSVTDDASVRGAIKNARRWIDEPPSSKARPLMTVKDVEILIKAAHASKPCEKLEEALELLEMFWRAYEDGAPCHEEDGGSYIGKAIELDDEHEKRVLALIPKFPSEHRAQRDK